MIVGVGSDVTDMRRIDATLAAHGERFLARVFTPQERALAESRIPKRRLAFYATRFAAKEAVMKALQTGLNHGVAWHDIATLSGEDGAPALHLSGGAKARLLELLPAGFHPVLHVSLSDETPVALALVVLEALEAQP